MPLTRASWNWNATPVAGSMNSVSCMDAGAASRPSMVCTVPAGRRRTRRSHRRRDPMRTARLRPAWPLPRRRRRRRCRHASVRRWRRGWRRCPPWTPLRHARRPPGLGHGRRRLRRRPTTRVPARAATISADNAVVRRTIITPPRVRVYDQSPAATPRFPGGRPRQFAGDGRSYYAVPRPQGHQRHRCVKGRGGSPM